jgi:16S rRNA processing protein RimM
MKASACFSPGFIIKPHGLKGAVTAKLTAKGVAVPQAGDVLFLDQKAQAVPFLVESCSSKGDTLYLKLEGIDTPEMAESLKGTSILLPPGTEPKPSADSSERLVGYEVTDEIAGDLGPITEILQSGSQETLSIKGKKGEILIPFVIPHVVTRIEHNSKTVFTRCPEGLLDLFSGE